MRTCQQFATLSEGQPPLHILSILVDHEVSILSIHLRSQSCYSRHCAVVIVRYCMSVSYTYLHLQKRIDPALTGLDVCRGWLRLCTYANPGAQAHGGVMHIGSACNETTPETACITLGVFDCALPLKKSGTDLRSMS